MPPEVRQIAGHMCGLFNVGHCAYVYIYPAQSPIEAVVYWLHFELEIKSEWLCVCL